MEIIRSRIYALLWLTATRVLPVVFLVCLSAGIAKADGTDTIPTPRSRREALKDTLKGHNPVDLLDIVKIILGIKDPRLRKKKVNESGPFYIAYVLPGYTQVTRFSVEGGFNVAFRPRKSIADKLSFLYNYVEYTENKQIIFISLSTLYSKDNKWVFPGDFRYFSFPTVTYGLGSSTLPSDIVAIDFSHFRFYRDFLRRVEPNTFVGIGYNLDYRWNITDYTADKGISDDFSKYGYTKTSSSSGPSASFLYDSRDDPNQPHIGTYISFQFRSHLKGLGSTSNWNSLVLDVRKFIPLTHKWYADLCFWGLAWLTLDGHPPYLDLPSVGWDSYNNTGREYPAGRYTGLNMLYLETEFRFNITANGLLGGVVFGNLETFTELDGSFFGPIQPGGGAGLRIMFNKNTRSNTCVDYGFGSHGARGFATNLNDIF